jgi:hypothetical protein
MMNASCAYLDLSMVMYVFRSLECAYNRPDLLLSVIPSVSCP